MVASIKVNGQDVRLTRFYRRTVEGDQGAALDELELVVMLRGRTVQRSFQELLRAPRFQIDIPGAGPLQMTLGSASLQTSGTGEAAIHRYDVTFREVPESAALRFAERKNEAVTPAKVTPVQAPAEDDVDEDDDGTVDLGEESTVAWAAALRQQSESRPSEGTAVPNEPLTPAELAGVESVLVGLRLEALVDALERAGVIRRGAVEDTFLDLVTNRFVAEATPVVGESAARRAARDVLSG